VLFVGGVVAACGSPIDLGGLPPGDGGVGDEASAFVDASVDATTTEKSVDAGGDLGPVGDAAQDSASRRSS